MRLFSYLPGLEPSPSISLGHIVGDIIVGRIIRDGIIGPTAKNAGAGMVIYRVIAHYRVSGLAIYQ